MAFDTYHSRRHINPTVVFRWLGWKATSVALMDAGWEISVREQVDWGGVAFALRHPTQMLQGISNSEDRRHFMYRDHYPGHSHTIAGPPEVMSVDIQVGGKILVHLADKHGLDFRPWDPTPQVMGYTEVELGHLPIFKTIKAPKEILLAEASIDEIVSMALTKQLPKDEAYHKYKEEEALLARNKPAALLRMVS